MIETEICNVIGAMSPDKRREVFEEAIRLADDTTIGAVLHGPSILCNMTRAEQAMHRSTWRERRFAAEMDRQRRLRKAVEALSRGGTVLLAYIGSLTDANAVAAAEKTAEAAKAAAA